MNLLILGANSDTAYAIAKTFAEKEKAELCLASRDMELLQKKARDLTVRFGVTAKAVFFDAKDYRSHESFYESLDPKPDGVVVAFGVLGDQAQAQNDFSQAKDIIETNLLGAVGILEIVSSDFEKRGHGFIIGLSSVAGERGRKSNYLYGAAKGGLTVYLSGLRNRFGKTDIRVMTVLPGFIRSKMTEHLKLPGLLSASPEEIAHDIYRAYKKKKAILYTKWFWKWIMLIIEHIPETVFKKTNL